MSTRQRIMHIIVLIACIFPMLLFGHYDPQKVVIKSASRIEIVNNPKSPEKIKNISERPSIEEDLVIGNEDKGPNYTFEAVSGIRVDEEENIYILDQ